MSVTLTNKVNGAIAGVELALSNISVLNSYNFTIGNSDFWAVKSIDEVTGAQPHVYIIGYESDVERFSTSKLFWPLTVNLRGITQSSTQSTSRENVSKLHADIHAAMFVDETLGGAVTRVIAGAFAVEASGVRESMHSVIDMDFQLDLHITEAQP